MSQAGTRLDLHPVGILVLLNVFVERVLRELDGGRTNHWHMARAECALVNARRTLRHRGEG